MRKFLSVIICLCLLLSSVPAFAEASPEISAWAKAEADKLSPDQKTLNIFTWTYYVPDEVVEQFMADTGIQVNYTASMGGNEDMLAKLNTSPGLYDVLLCSDYIISIMADMDLISQIDPSRIPNYKNIDPAFQGQFYDPDNQFSIPYTNTIPLIVYNPDKVPFEVKGYADLWREEFDSSLSCVGEMRVITGMAQKKLGLSYNETDPAQMARVAEELEALKPNILSFNDDTPHNLLVSGDAIGGFMFGSQIVEAKKVMPQLKVVYPAEGLGFGIDNFVVTKDAPHLDATYIFLNYILDGQVSAWASSLINYGNCNLAAGEFLPESYKTDETVNAPEALVATAEMIRPLDNETQAIYDEIWVNFRQ